MRIDETTRALVTGGTQGLGYALAAELRARGAEVVVVARRPAPLPEGVALIEGDIAELSPAELVARVTEYLGAAPTLLIHNASTLGPVPMPELADLSDDALLRVFEVNTLAPARVTRAFVGVMRAQGYGHILSVSSDAAVEAYAGWGAYGASKAALDHLQRVLREELADSGLSASAVDPGEMNTQMHADALPDADPASLANPADVAMRILARLAQGDVPARWQP